MLRYLRDTNINSCTSLLGRFATQPISGFGELVE